jgi:hypothetical protein
MSGRLELPRYSLDDFDEEESESVMEAPAENAGENFVIVSEGASASSIRLRNGLTAAEEAYCRARALGMGVNAAVRAAKLSIRDTTASHWESPTFKGYRKEIVSRIEELSKAATDTAILATGLNRQWVLARLKTLVEKCMDREGKPVMQFKGGKWVPSGRFYKLDADGAGKNLERIAKTLGMFDGTAQGETGYEQFGDAELVLLIRGKIADLRRSGVIEDDSGAGEAAISKETQGLQALSEAGRIPQRGQEIQGEIVSRGESVGEDVGERL